MKRRLMSITAVALVVSMVMSGAVPGVTSAKAPKLDSKKISIMEGTTEVIKLKHGSKLAKVTWKSKKSSVVKIVSSVSKGNKAKAKIKGMKVGKTKITATYKLGKTKKKYSCNVKVYENNIEIPTLEPAASPTIAPQATEAPSAVPTEEPLPTEEPVPQLITAVQANRQEISDGYTNTRYDVPYRDIVSANYYSKKLNSEKSVYIVLPPEFDKNDTETKYPVVYLLHGIGCWKGQFGEPGPADRSAIAKIYYHMLAEGKCKEMILVFPDVRISNEPETNMHSPENYKLWDAFREELIDSIIPFMESDFNAASGRENVGVCGWSMGGREALYTGLSRPDVVGYCAGFCPAVGLIKYAREDGLLCKTDVNPVITLDEEYIDNTYVQISAGAKDTVVHGEPKNISNALTAGGVEHLYIEYPNGVHGDNVIHPGFYMFLSNAFKLVGE